MASAWTSLTFPRKRSAIILIMQKGQTEIWDVLERAGGSSAADIFDLLRHFSLQTTVPNSFPMPAVRAMASAPQNVTRAVPRRTFAPPALAPIAPNSARKPKDAADTIGTSPLAGDTTTISKGIAAPTENITADVSAAWTGRAVGTPC